MRCPFCSAEDTQVKDSRPNDDGTIIRRRRFCGRCNSRFTTCERIQLRELIVMKKNGEKRPFDREKIARAINIAVRKRAINDEQIELAVNNIVRELETLGEQEIPTILIGDLVMKALARIDRVAYIRFASVYKDFSETEDFERFIRNLAEEPLNDKS